MTSPLVNPDGYSTLSRLDERQRVVPVDRRSSTAVALDARRLAVAQPPTSWPWPRLRRRVALAGRLGRLDAGLERRHQVDDLRLLGRRPRAPRTPRRRPSARSGRAPARGSRRGTCRARTSSVSDSTSASAILHLACRTRRRRRARASSSIVGRVDDLVGVGQRRHHEPAVLGPDRRRVLLVAHHEAADGDLAALLHRPRQQHVRLGVGVGRDVVGVSK